MATIRDMTIDDYDAVMALWRRCEGIGLSDADRRERIAFFLERNPGTCFVAFEGDQAVGAVLCGCDGRRGYLHHLAVAPEARRQGLGGELARRCLEALRQMGVTKCHIFVIGANQSGLVFWRRLGWYERPELVLMSMDIK